ncbi:group II intron reverse transcriptase/maturase [Parabacteroides sp. PF5-5]|uniref:group II intron reverse transcriptase/maturase n=1 Tax=unclassified Parabacteroides TaxID=2649774 RepID=UPI0024752B7F|nr:MULTISPECIES: group II intron reverse transcriptase/maturase [unclassified Parabacteroides]MDH6307072.1 group II intron reverse transcriptase/maturase [Parabacteroides sp. PH5-39]MDH6318002.1 group II intron reverse transcriptase/maturase [Parabacteroides sp. PF5-13]MDH6321729.1 group II intron reverse transcriptase/maturase [Parabacteroides sp. PH5-13]MDH6325460.1 group II intron reverse transcriptase/maturase [Parabacteroides sp. PH5-8]MDH6329191.1 group II intron reverse transcriptase/ma
MRNSENVLNSLSRHSKSLNYKFERLYRILFNVEMYYVAYQRIYAKEGNMTKGSDGKTIDGMNLKRIEKLIDALKNESYQPQPSLRTYIPKKNGKKRPLGIPAFDDKLIQEVVRMVLEAIYEGRFENCSYGFRPKRSCHTALTQIQKTFSGAKWFVEGDIKGFFDNINHDILISVLKERIVDERFIRLIRKFLKAGYLEDWKFHRTYSGTPQGGIISPILANIYLDRLDKFMMNYIKNFDKGDKRKVNPERIKYDYGKRLAVLKLKTVTDTVERKLIIKQIKAFEKERTTISNGIEMDSDYRRMKYVRYADDFLIGIIGSKADSQKVKEDITRFLSENLKLELSDEKTLITHTEKSAKFLGYEIYVRKSNLTKRDSLGRMVRAFNKKVYLKLPMDTIKKKLIDSNMMELRYHNGKEQWKPKCFSQSINNDDLEILEKYNSMIRGFYNYYSIANNCSILSHYRYIMQYSMYKTFAGKYKTTVGKIAKRYVQNGIFTVRYENSKKVIKTRIFYNEGFKRKTPNFSEVVDKIPTIYHTNTTSLIDRLKAEKCELCGSEGALIMHHVRKLKNLEGKKPWERLMIARRRKTIALCKSCHQRTHWGKIDC